MIGAFAFADEPGPAGDPLQTQREAGEAGPVFVGKWLKALELSGQIFERVGLGGRHLAPL